MPASDQQVPQPVTDDEVATFINTMGGQFALVVAEIWHTHPDFGVRQTLDELNRRFPVPQPEPLHDKQQLPGLLTDQQLRECFLATNTAEPLSEGWPGLERFARAIERAIREKP